jgi:putative SOS response-associated peptidase YedK
MCNHYHNIPGAQHLLQTWREYISWSTHATPAPDTALADDIWPRREAAVVRQCVDSGGAVIDQMIWGVPFALPGKRAGTTVTKHITNVRNLQSPFWRSMLAKPEQRCLVPFSSFAEPKIGVGREEHWFHVNDRPVAAFAGVWRWAAAAGPAAKQASPDDLLNNLEDADQSQTAAPAPPPAKVFAFLTCAPNPLVAPLHPKAMPVILHEADYQAWLTADWAEASALAVPFPSQLMALE